ncbi:hypothetical protein EGR_11180 [Echinococcus granulosus]|uniref:Uncharacterized protein n=1 Tax=Echinococcus granulosus TaxID=6210 RepID=W6TZ26_ECHGR|nr:hypothetical protein EGR_11180 [Echinococcus granulosus]EUB53963.1 hypothetical protein EGR_11180 [Echinococcus granulosus]
MPWAAFVRGCKCICRRNELRQFMVPVVFDSNSRKKNVEGCKTSTKKMRPLRLCQYFAEKYGIMRFTLVCRQKCKSDFSISCPTYAILRAWKR